MWARALSLPNYPPYQHKIYCNVKIELRCPQEPAQETGMDEYEKTQGLILKNYCLGIRVDLELNV